MKRWLTVAASLILASWLTILTVVFIQYRSHTLSQLKALSTQTVQTDNSELVALRAQVQQISDYNDDLLSTVHWSIGFASTFLLAFLGLAGYLSNRRYEQDKEAVQTMLAAKIAEVRAELGTKIDSSKESLHTENQSVAKELKGSLQELARSAAKSAVSSVKDQVENMNRDFLLMKRDTLEAAAKEAKTNKNWRKALSNYFEVAKIGKEIDWEWIISGALKDIETVLD